jgi:hypothetical protein
MALDVVLCDQMTLESSSTYLPFGHSMMFFLIPVNMMSLALSTAPLDCSWYTEAKHKLLPSSVQNYLKVVQSTCLPLSTVTSLGTPKQHTMLCQKNFWSAQLLYL